MAGAKFNLRQRQELKQLIIETEIQNLPRDHALTYIKEHLGQEVSPSYVDHLKAYLRKDSGQKIAYFRKHRFAYLQLFFDRIDELRTLQKENWALYHRSNDNPQVQNNCLRELHQLTISIGNYYDLLPTLTSTYVPSYNNAESPSRQEEQQASGELSEIPV